MKPKRASGPPDAIYADIPVAKDQRIVQPEIVVPDEDFILFVGTSHTYGSCNLEPNIKGRLQLDDRYSTLIGKELGMKVLCLGYPGIDNLGLLQVVNELLKLKVFTENCKMFILEPRVGATMIRFHKDLDNQKFVDSMKGGSWHNTSKANTFGGFQAEHDGRNSVLERLVGMQGNRDASVVDIPQSIVEYRLAFESTSVGTAFNDLQIIQTIKNLVNVPFSWLMMDPPSVSLIKGEYWDNMELVKRIYGEWLDIFDDLIGGDNVRWQVMSYKNWETWTQSEYFCNCCPHFNEKGNALIAEVLTPHIKRKI